MWVLLSLLGPQSFSLPPPTNLEVQGEGDPTTHLSWRWPQWWSRALFQRHAGRWAHLSASWRVARAPAFPAAPLLHMQNSQESRRGSGFGHQSCWNMMGEGSSRRVTRQRPSLLCHCLASELGQRQGRRVTKSELVCTSQSSGVRIRPQRAVRLLLSNTDRLFAGHVVRGGPSSSPLPE